MSQIAMNMIAEAESKLEETVCGVKVTLPIDISRLESTARIHAAMLPLRSLLVRKATFLAKSAAGDIIDPIAEIESAAWEATRLHPSSSEAKTISLRNILIGMDNGMIHGRPEIIASVDEMLGKEIRRSPYDGLYAIGISVEFKPKAIDLSVAAKDMRPALESLLCRNSDEENFDQDDRWIY